MYVLKQLYHRLRLTWRYFRTNGIPEVAPAHPAALARAKGQGVHYFVVIAEWSDEDQTWLVSCPEISGDILTNHDDLPGALAMFGDVAMLLLEMDMEHDLYPPKRAAGDVEIIHHEQGDLLGSVGANTTVLMRWDTGKIPGAGGKR